MARNAIWGKPSGDNLGIESRIPGAMPSNAIDAPLFQKQRTGPLADGTDMAQSPPEGVIRARISPNPKTWAMKGEDVYQDDQRSPRAAAGTQNRTTAFDALAQTSTSNLPMRLASRKAAQLAMLRKRGLISDRASELTDNNGRRDSRIAGIGVDTSLPQMSAD